MGCDIRIFVEYYNHRVGQWGKPFEVEVNRNYDMFGILAGVRSLDYEPIDEPRGVPADCKNWKSGDLPMYVHSHSFVYGEEVLARSKPSERRLLRVLRKIIKDSKLAPERVRFVFCFNS